MRWTPPSRRSALARPPVQAVLGKRRWIDLCNAEVRAAVRGARVRTMRSYVSALLVVAQPLYRRQITNPERKRLPLPLTGCDSPGVRSVRARSPPTAQEQCRSRLRAEGLPNHGSAFFSRALQTVWPW